MKPTQINFIGATVTAPVHYSLIIGNQTISADYMQAYTAKPRQVILPVCGKEKK